MDTEQHLALLIALHADIDMARVTVPTADHPIHPTEHRHMDLEIQVHMDHVADHHLAVDPHQDEEVPDHLGHVIVRYFTHRVKSGILNLFAKISWNDLPSLRFGMFFYAMLGMIAGQWLRS